MKMKLLASAGQAPPLKTRRQGTAKVLVESDVAALFGLEMAETTYISTPVSAVPKAIPTVQGEKREQDACQETKPATKTDTSTSCDSGQFGNEKDNPSKCQKAAHSAATIVFRMTVSGPMARNGRTTR